MQCQIFSYERGPLHGAWALITPLLPHLLLRKIAGGLKTHGDVWGLITDDVQLLLL